MQTAYRHGLLPLSADPITNGHIDIITRASQLCEKLTVYVSYNGHKRGQYLFSLEERTYFAEVACANVLGNVTVVSGDWLLTDLYLEQGCDVLIRGIRNDEDERYEDQQIEYHTLIYPPIRSQVLYLRAQPMYTHVSSSLVKAFVERGVDVSSYVSPQVKAALEERIASRYYVGITGEIAAGKSTIAKALVAHALHEGIPATHIDIDALSKQALFAPSEGGTLLRERIAAAVEEPDLFEGSQAEVLKRFRALFFDPDLDQAVRQQVHELIKPHVERHYRATIQGVTGLIVYEWAQLIEMNMLGLVNNHVIVVRSTDRAVLAKGRGVSNAHYRFLSSVQRGVEAKLEAARAQVTRDSFGSVISVENTQSSDPAIVARDLFDELVSRGVLPHHEVEEVTK